MGQFIIGGCKITGPSAPLLRFIQPGSSFEKGRQFELGMGLELVSVTHDADLKKSRIKQVEPPAPFNEISDPSLLLVFYITIAIIGIYNFSNEMMSNNIRFS